MSQLLVELVPSPSWGDNLRSRLPRDQWDTLRREAYQKAGHVCEICGGKGRRHPVEAHERWAYDDINHVQTLVGIEALCPDCHSVRHLGKAFMDDRGKQAIAHLVKVNGWGRRELDDHVRKAFKVHAERSEHPWTLDLSWLEGKGIET